MKINIKRPFTFGVFAVITLFVTLFCVNVYSTEEKFCTAYAGKGDQISRHYTTVRLKDYGVYFAVKDTEWRTSGFLRSDDNPNFDKFEYNKGNELSYVRAVKNNNVTYAVKDMTNDTVLYIKQCH